MSGNFITIVYECDKNSQLREDIREAFRNGPISDKGIPYKDGYITAISMEDEISRVESLENE